MVIVAIFMGLGGAIRWGGGRCESHIREGGGEAPRGDKVLSGESTPLDATYLLKWKDRVEPDNLT